MDPHLSSIQIMGNLTTKEEMNLGYTREQPTIL